MSRSSRRSSWVTGVLAALAVLLGAAPATLADSSILTTGHPDLLAAEAISSKQVLACFDQILAPPFSFTDASFFLQGYTEGRKSGAPGLTLSTRTSTGNGFCVVGLFTGPGDVRSYSRLNVLANAVNASIPGGVGAGNVQGSAALAGSDLPYPTGGALRPQLTGATTNAANKGVLFTFNEPLTAAAGTTSFGFYTSADPAFHAGTVTGFTPGSAVAVAFSDADVALFGQATRFVVKEAAVTDASGQTNPVGTVAVGTGATKRLDLAPTTGPVAASGPLTYRFDFTAAIPNTAVICASKFALYDATGVRYSPAPGAPVTISASATSVTLTFTPNTAIGDPAAITLATVTAGALDGASCATAATPLNSDGAVGLPVASGNPGTTSGPDLTSFTINRSAGTVAFVFDAPVASSAIVPGAFHLVDQSAALSSPPNQGGCLLGPPASGPVFSVSPANTVTVTFAGTTCSLLNLLPGPPDLASVSKAVGVTVDEGAVADATTGVLSPLGSLGVTAGAPTGPTGPTTPPPGVVPPVTTPKPTTPTKTPTAKKCTRVVTIHLRSSVSGNLRSATATINGKKATVSKKLAITVTFAKYIGVKKVVVRIKGRLRNGHSITRTKTYTNKC